MLVPSFIIPICHWMKEGGFSNKDPYFLNFTDEISDPSLEDEEDDNSVKNFTPSRNRERLMQKKSMRSLDESPQRKSLLQADEEGELSDKSN